MRSNNYRALGLSLAALILSACTTTATRTNLDEKLTQEVQVKDRTGLAAESKDLIEKADALTPTQKTGLLALREATRQKMIEMQKESVKLRSVLIQDVLSPNYNQKEINLIKNRISKLEKNRVTVIFNTVDEANRILGRTQFENKDRLVEELMRDRQRGEF